MGLNNHVWRFTASIGVVAAIATTTACSGAEGNTSAPDESRANQSEIAGEQSPRQSDAPSTAGSQTAGEIPALLPAPLRPYMLSAESYYTIMTAENILADQCMAEFGFDPSENSLDREAMLREEQATDARLFGITDMESARKYGYMPPPDFFGEPSSADEQMSDAHFFVLYGATPDEALSPGSTATSPGEVGGRSVPAGGCLGAARVDLWGDADAQAKDQFSQQLRTDTYFQAQSDPAVQGALNEWARCMQAAGFTYQSPLEPHFPRDPGSEAPAVEIETALADVACKEQTQLVKRWNDTYVRYQTTAIEKNELALEELRREIETAVDRAVDVAQG